MYARTNQPPCPTRLVAAAWSCRAAGLAACWLPVCGCLTPGTRLGPLDRAAAEAAHPILTLDPNAVWTDAYNRLVALGPDAIAYLMRQPAMTRLAVPDDLDVLLHTSLVRLLADPTSGPPRLSATSLETTLGLLHFDLKVRGDRLGAVVLPPDARPRAWHEFYPAEFNHVLAGRIDLEADRRALGAWWRQRQASSAPATARRLQPHARELWHILARRYADWWGYQPEQGVVLCAVGPPRTTLLEFPTADYNLVRAACIWLGSSHDDDVQRRLIELIGSASSILSHNARFALSFSPDERIRALLRRYEQAAPRNPPDGR